MSSWNKVSSRCSPLLSRSCSSLSIFELTLSSPVCFDDLVLLHWRIR